MEAGTGVQLGSLWAQSFPTPHDAAGSVGYILSGEESRIVLATDLGYITPEVKAAVRDCGLLVCEANHDEDWVRSGPYPYYLKQRILGDRGHLSNEAGAELAALAVERGTQAVVLAHLSHENNTPARAWETAARHLRSMGCEPDLGLSLSVAPPQRPGPHLSAGRRAGPPGICRRRGGRPVLSVYLICVGKLKEKFYQDACAEYIKRLSAYCRLTLVELPEEKLPQTPSQGQIDQALAGRPRPSAPSCPQRPSGRPVRRGPDAVQ